MTIFGSGRGAALRGGIGAGLVIPDTSPRGSGCRTYRALRSRSRRRFLRECHPGTVVATLSHVRLRHRELPALVETNLPITEARSITGHSMGGHGALICALREPERYRSVSAFAPICHPMACGWGKAVSKGSRPNREDWVAYDAVRLIEEGAQAIPLLIDQGTADEFLAQQLHSASLERICAARDFPLTLRWQKTTITAITSSPPSSASISPITPRRCAVLVSSRASFWIFRETGSTETLAKSAAGRIEPRPAAGGGTVHRG